MQCRNHPSSKAIAVCQKNETGYCRMCCECMNIDHCCECTSPKLYCTFRSRCMVWEMSRDRRKKAVDRPEA
jgi:hypothetical protein